MKLEEGGGIPGGKWGGRAGGIPGGINGGGLFIISGGPLGAPGGGMKLGPICGGTPNGGGGINIGGGPVPGGGAELIFASNCCTDLKEASVKFSNPNSL